MADSVSHNWKHLLQDIFRFTAHERCVQQDFSAEIPKVINFILVRVWFNR